VGGGGPNELESTPNKGEKSLQETGGERGFTGSNVGHAQKKEKIACWAHLVGGGKNGGVAKGQGGRTAAEEGGPKSSNSFTGDPIPEGKVWVRGKSRFDVALNEKKGEKKTPQNCGELNCGFFLWKKMFSRENIKEKKGAGWQTKKKRQCAALWGEPCNISLSGGEGKWEIMNQAVRSGKGDLRGDKAWEKKKEWGIEEEKGKTESRTIRTFREKSRKEIVEKRESLERNFERHNDEGNSAGG